MVLANDDGSAAIASTRKEPVLRRLQRWIFALDHETAKSLTDERTRRSTTSFDLRAHVPAVFRLGFRDQIGALSARAFRSKHAPNSIAIGWLIRAVCVAAIALASACAAKKPFDPGYGHPTPEQIDALLKAPLPGKDAPAAETPFSISLWPTRFVFGGATVWIQCIVPDRYGPGRLRFGVDGVRVSEGPLEQPQNRLLIVRFPCISTVAFCDLLTTAGVLRLRRELPIDPLGCEGGL